MSVAAGSPSMRSLPKGVPAFSLWGLPPLPPHGGLLWANRWRGTEGDVRTSLAACAESTSRCEAEKELSARHLRFAMGLLRPAAHAVAEACTSWWRRRPVLGSGNVSLSGDCAGEGWC